MITITKKWLTGKGACSAGMELYAGAGEPELPLDEIIAHLAKCAHEHRYSFASWVLTQAMTPMQCVQYACHAARQALPVFEDKFGDTRPRKAIEAAEAYIAAAAGDAAAAAAAAGDADMWESLLNYGLSLILEEADHDNNY